MEEGGASSICAMVGIPILMLFKKKNMRGCCSLHTVTFKSTNQHQVVNISDLDWNQFIYMLDEIKSTQVSQVVGLLQFSSPADVAALVCG